MLIYKMMYGFCGSPVQALVVRLKGLIILADFIIYDCKSRQPLL